jgi:hypothetical protein
MLQTELDISCVWTNQTPTLQNRVGKVLLTLASELKVFGQGKKSQSRPAMRLTWLKCHKNYFFAHFYVTFGKNGVILLNR